MCDTHAPTDGHTSAHGEESATTHCGHCNHEDLTLSELKDRRAELDRDIAARERVHADSNGLDHIA